MRTSKKGIHHSSNNEITVTKITKASKNESATMCNKEAADKKKVNPQRAILMPNTRGMKGTSDNCVLGLVILNKKLKRINIPYKFPPSFQCQDLK